MVPATVIKIILVVQFINMQFLQSPAFLTDTNVYRHHNDRLITSLAFQSIEHDLFSRPFISRKYSFKHYMAPPKSGGRPILSMEEFQTQVLSAGSNSAVPNALNSSKPIRKPILVFYTAPWCGPCRLSIPIIKEIINQFHEMIDIVDVCTDDLPEIAESAGVLSIPTIQIYHNGELMDTIVGCVSTKVLTSSVTKVLEDIGFKVEGK